MAKPSARAVATNAVGAKATPARAGGIGRATYPILPFTRCIAAVARQNIAIVATFVTFEQTIAAYTEAEVNPTRVTAQRHVDPARSHRGPPVRGAVAEPPAKVMGFGLDQGDVGDQLLEGSARKPRGPA